MTESVLDKKICLQLNANWQPIGHRTVRQAIIALTGDGETPPALAMDISDESVVPTKWEDWLNLPIRHSDLTIMTGKGPIRAPLVILTPNYAKMPIKKPRLSTGNIRQRDGGVCQYTGQKLSRKDGNVDHIIPISKGGKNTWENMVYCKEKLNKLKGNRFNHEVGLNLIRKPQAPKPVPASYLIEATHPDHEKFITK